MALRFWIGAGGALALAIAAGLGERRRKRRADLDSVSLVDWPGVQVLALIAAAILAGIAWNTTQ